MFIKNPAEFWDGIGIVTLSSVLDNVQLGNYFLPVKMSPLQLQLARVFIYLFFPLSLASVVRLVMISRGQRLPALSGMSFCKRFSLENLPWTQKFAVFTLCNYNLCLFISKFSRLMGGHGYYFLEVITFLDFITLHAYIHIHYLTAFFITLLIHM